jgi:assimilatory nitrate reductase catalytic subunit
MAGLQDGGFARVTTQHGGTVLRVCIRPGQQRGSIFAPIHWSDATASDARVGALAMADTDPFSGQPELKATPARVEPVEFAYRGFALTRERIALPHGTWFARVAVAGGHGLLFATNELPTRWHGLAEQLIADDSERAEYIDLPRGIVRIAAFRDGRIEACIFCGPAQNSPHWEIVRALFDAGVLAERDRRILLSGRSAEGMAESGPIVCACFGVGLEAIRRAMTQGTAVNVAEIGRALRAGTNCGSCIPELQGIVERAAAATAGNGS